MPSTNSHVYVPSDGATCVADVYYDGGCPLCRAEIAAYQRAEGGNQLRWVDAHGCAPAELGGDLLRSAAMAKLHVRRADGTLLRGAAAFVEIWSALPRWAWAARLARLPGVLTLLDVGYAIFLFVRPLWRRAPSSIDRLPRALRRELRTDHAGETGAEMIYRGILAVTRDPALRDFAVHHLATERRHLAVIEHLVPRRWRSRLLPLWRFSGWLTGALPACFGPRAVYATIQAVETFVDHHYAKQVAAVDALLAERTDDKANHDAESELRALRALLEECRLDEVTHRDEAAARWDGGAGPVLATWRALVGCGSAAAVCVCRHL